MGSAASNSGADCGKDARAHNGSNAQGYELNRAERPFELVLLGICLCENHVKIFGFEEMRHG